MFGTDMEKPTLTFRLEPDLVPVLDEQAKTVGKPRSAHLASIIESHLRRNGHAPKSEDLVQKHDEILQSLRAVSMEASTLTQVIAHKEREASAEAAELGRQIEQLRSDIATLFGAALETFAAVPRGDAIEFTQKYMYPGHGG